MVVEAGPQEMEGQGGFTPLMEGFLDPDSSPEPPVGGDMLPGMEGLAWMMDGAAPSSARPHPRDARRARTPSRCWTPTAGTATRW